MPRAANLQDEENIPDGGQISSELTALHPSVASATAAATREDTHHSSAMGSAGAVATAFLTNVSGGAACYDVDVGLIAINAATDELSQVLGSMRRLMAFADGHPTGWAVAESQHDAAAPNVVVVVAMATTGRGDDTSMEKQEFTLHVDLTSSSKPITKVTWTARQKQEKGPWQNDFACDFAPRSGG